MNKILLSLDRYTILLGLLCVALCLLVLAKNFDRPTVQRAGQNLWLWRIVVFKYANGSFIVFSSAVIGAHLLTQTQESWLSCIIATAKFWEAFLNQDIGKLKAEIQAAMGFETTVVTRQSVQTIQQTPTNPATEQKTP